MKKILLVCMLVSSTLFAQNNQAKLAYQYYQNGQYDKAIELYKELNKKEQDFLQVVINSSEFQYYLMNEAYK